MSGCILDTPGTWWVRERVDEAGVLVDAEDYYAMFHACAERAERSILLAGWQFDSEVALLRGESAEGRGEVRLLRFLNELCERNPALRIHILAWDFSVVFSMEREWLQRVAFDWRTHHNLRFEFDTCVIAEGSHHQKFAVVDESIAFVGGTDLCDHRWDRRSHREPDELRRDLDGHLYPPYHEVHSYFTGPAVRPLAAFFRRRWACAASEELELSAPPAPLELPMRRGLPLAAREVAIARTEAAGEAGPCEEIRAQLVTAIAAAERLIYAETQYLSARAVEDALVARMRDRTLPILDVIFVIPETTEAFKETVAVGVSQARLIERVRSVARETGHHVGFYVTVAPGASKDGHDVATYIHSKVMVVDDRFLTLGSANLANRSMGVDTELNVAFEADGAESEASIRAVRVSLLAEHLGARDEEIPELTASRGLVARLDAACRARTHRLRFFAGKDPSAEDPVLSVVHAGLSQFLDPETPMLEAAMESPAAWGDMLARSVARLRELFGR